MAFAHAAADSPAFRPKRWNETLESDNGSAAGTSAEIEFAAQAAQFYSSGVEAFTKLYAIEVKVVEACMAPARVLAAEQAEPMGSSRVRPAVAQIVKISTALLTGRKVALLLLKEYAALGSMRGTRGVSPVWKRNSEIASALLVQRARFDPDVQRLAQVSGLLSELGEDGLTKTLEALARGSGEHGAFVEALLRAVQWTPQQLTESQLEDLHRTLERLSRSDDPDIREATYDTSLRLPAQVARDFLGDARRRETDARLLGAIQEIEAEIHG